MDNTTTDIAARVESERGKHDCFRCGGNIPPREARDIREDGRQFHRSFGSCIDVLSACLTERAAQIAQLQSQLAEAQAASNALAEYAEHVEGCVECGETSWTHCHVGTSLREQTNLYDFRSAKRPHD